jgi:hypothetical protein
MGGINTMKKALVLGLFALALLIGFAMAEDLDESAYSVPSETEIAAMQVDGCPYGIAESCGSPDGDKPLCGQTITGFPGQKLYLSVKDAQEGFDYEWVVKLGDEIKKTVPGKTLTWYVPAVSAEGADYTICLNVYNKMDKTCNDKCCFTVHVDPYYCCPEKEIKECETNLPLLTTYCYGLCCPVNNLYFKWQIQDPNGNVYDLPLASGSASLHRCVIISWPVVINLAKLKIGDDVYNGEWKVLLKIGNTKDCIEYTCEGGVTTVVYEQPKKPDITVSTKDPCPV